MAWIKGHMGSLWGREPSTFPSSTSHLPAHLERSSDGEEPTAAPQLPCVRPSPAWGSSPGSSAPSPPWVLGWVSCPVSLTEYPPREWAGWNGYAVLNIRSPWGPVIKSTQIQTSLSETKMSCFCVTAPDPRPLKWLLVPSSTLLFTGCGFGKPLWFSSFKFINGT